MDHIEDQANEITRVGPGPAPQERILLASIAISLKRISDTLEDLVDELKRIEIDPS